MTRNYQIVIAAAVVLAAAVASAYYFGAARGCSSREDATSRVAGTTSDLQQAASEGKITIAQLADGVRRINTAATTYETDNDHAAYCEAINALRDELIAKR